MSTTSLRSRRPASRPGSNTVVHRCADIAREVPGTYDDGDDPPFGLPVLGELPDLAHVLTSIAEADRTLRRAVLALVPLLAADRIETTTGVGVDHWLAATTRMTGLDRRLLRRMCRLLERLPALAHATGNDRISFAQLRGLTLELHAVSRDIDGPLDAWLDATIDELPADADPDVLVRQAGRAADELAPERLDHVGDTITRGLTIQPFLDGTGGTFHGTEDAIGLALLDAATRPRHDQLTDIACARADNLQDRLRHTCTNEPSKANPAANDDASDHIHDDHLHDMAAPTLLLRMDLDSLLGVTDTPADLLTSLVGGRLRLAAGHARRLIDRYGVKLRTVLVEDGDVLGVGRTTRLPTRWLRQIVLAIHDTCTEPHCDRPATTCQLDHAIDWAPTPDSPGGTTDADNLGPLCGHTNQHKHTSGWKVTQTLPGLRMWSHPRSGLTVTTIPGTWRPKHAPPPPKRRPRHPPASVPPEGDIRAPTSPRGIGPPRHDDPANADLPPPPDDPLPF